MLVRMGVASLSLPMKDIVFCLTLYSIQTENIVKRDGTHEGWVNIFRFIKVKEKKNA